MPPQPLTQDEAFALLKASFDSHGEATADGEDELYAWVNGANRDGVPRSEINATADGARGLHWIAKTVRESSWIGLMISGRPGGKWDRYAVKAAIAGLDSGTRHC